MIFNTYKKQSNNIFEKQIWLAVKYMNSQMINQYENSQVIKRGAAKVNGLYREKLKAQCFQNKTNKLQK